MTVLLTLIVILQAVIVAWMVFITLLMFSHDTDIKCLKPKKIQEYVADVEKYAGRVEEIIEEIKSDRAKAQQVVDQAKKIQHDVQLQQARSAMNPVNQPVFKYVEPEEDPENPRS